MNKAESRSFPNYEKPPVVEVVCGIVFETIKGFKAQHLGLFWQKVRDRFPECKHAVRLGFNPETEPLDLANYLPRVWFISAKQNTLIQLQDNTFFFNWRKMEEDETYPRYSIIIEAFKTYPVYFSRAVNDGAHIHPWHYYLNLLTFFKMPGHPLWSEGVIVVLGLTGISSCLKKTANPFFKIIHNIIERKHILISKSPKTFVIIPIDYQG